MRNLTPILLLLSLSSFKLEIAENPQDLMTGLMFRESMDEDTAMLFKFPFKQYISLWMMNVQFDLDVAFLDDDYKILEIKFLKAFPHIKDKYFFQKRAIRSSFFVQYALEAKQGFFKQQNLKVGDVIPPTILNSTE